MIELWKPVVGSFLYEVSNYGRVRSSSNSRHGKDVQPILLNDRVVVRLPNINSSTRELNTLDRLVAEAFLGLDELEDSNHIKIIHRDRDPFNCRVDNLYWDEHE